MDLLVVPVPFFNKSMEVSSYYFRYQKGNDLLDSNRSLSSALDGAVSSPLLETLNTVGLEAFTMGKPIFVPITALSLLVNLEQQCKQPPDKVVFVMNTDVKPEEAYLRHIRQLREMGFRFAMQRVQDLDAYRPLLELCDYIFISAKAVDGKLKLFQLKREFAFLQVVMTHIDSAEAFERCKKEDCALFEGRFYRIPISRGAGEKVSPLQANLIRLLNLVQDENFEFDHVAAIIQRDTVLTVSLLRMVNSPYLGLSKKVKTIGHAVAILGQQEVRKWVTTAVAQLLGSEKPDAVTRLSLIRAKFCENLAGKFELGVFAQSLFLMGLFSVLDVILDMPMKNALDMVMVADDIRKALLENKGKYYPVLEFLKCYESADWSSVSRLLIVYDATPEDIYRAYIDAACWYRDLLLETEETPQQQEEEEEEEEEVTV